MQTTVRSTPFPSRAASAAAYGDSRALILEDDVLQADLLADHLTALGCRVIAKCRSVTEARAELKRTRPCFALLDVHLGERETSKPIQRILRFYRIPYALLTAYPSAADAAPGLNYHIVAPKPFNPETIELAVAALLHKSRS
ncbi:response regulator [Hyphococcus sp.]|uniref:response regulator n=1 Tax=Hyphococcus sp. TaxID=2038636 RepID=UPI0035C66ADA